MKTYINLTELSNSELTETNGGDRAPSGSLSYDAVYLISYAVGFASDSLRLSMTVSGALFGRTW